MAASPAFARARTAQQREERRAVILDTAALMLQDSRVAELSLNELSRRVGLAKSNVLRYFESREAVLLELLGREYDGWLDAIDIEFAADGERDIGRIADVVARTVAERPLLCELLANASTVLEHNVSADVAADYKRGALARAARLSRQLGGEGDADVALLAGAVNMAIGGIWGMCRPSSGMLAAYRKYPELAAYRLDLEPTLREFVLVMLTGVTARRAGA